MFLTFLTIDFKELKHLEFSLEKSHSPGGKAKTKENTIYKNWQQNLIINSDFYIITIITHLLKYN